MNVWIDNMTELLISQSLHLAVLFCLILVLSLLCHKKSTHLRYLLWTVILVKCLVPPLFTISMAVLPQEREDAVVQKGQPERAEPMVVDATETMPVDSSQFEGVSHGMTGAIVSVSPVESASVPSSQWSTRTWGVVIWGFGAVGFTMIMMIRTIRFGRTLKQSRKPTDASLSEQILLLAKTLDSSLQFRVFQVPGISQPFVWGGVSGCIYVPSDFEQTGTLQKRNSVLLHEMGHVMRRDPLVNLIQVVVQAVYWFHPLVWVANQKIRAEREKCCDEIALAKLNTSPKEYGSAIVDTLIHEYQSRTAIPTLAVAGPVKNLEDRIKTIMKPGKRFYTRPSVQALIVTLLLAVVAVPTTIAFTQKDATHSMATASVESHSTVASVTGKAVYSNTEYIVPAQVSPTDLSGVETVELFDLTEMHVSGWPIRGGYRDLIKTRDKDRALKIGEMLDDMGSNMAPQVEEMAGENQGSESARAQALSKEDLQQIEQLIQAYGRIPYSMDIESIEPLFEFKDDKERQRFIYMMREEVGQFDGSSVQDTDKTYIMAIKPAGNNRINVSALTPFQGHYMLRTTPCIRTDQGWKIGIDVQKMINQAQQARELGPEKSVRRELQAQLKMWENAQGQTLVTLYEEAKTQARLRVQAMRFAKENGLSMMQMNFTEEKYQQELEKISAKSPENYRREMIAK